MHPIAERCAPQTSTEPQHRVFPTLSESTHWLADIASSTSSSHSIVSRSVFACDVADLLSPFDNSAPNFRASFSPAYVGRSPQLINV